MTFNVSSRLALMDEHVVYAVEQRAADSAVVAMVVGVEVDKSVASFLSDLLPMSKGTSVAWSRSTYC